MTDLAVATAELNVEVNPGEPLTLTIPIVDAVGAPVVVGDATAWSVTSQVRTDWRAPDVLHTWTSAGATPNAVVVEGLAGAVILSATGAETAAWQQAWPEQTAAFDLFVTDQAGAAHCLAAGQIRLIPRTTR